MAVSDRLYRASLRLVPPLYRALSSLLFASCRIERHGQERYQQFLASGQPFIACFWHYSLAFVLPEIVGRDWVAMVSASRDAEYVSRILNGMGLATVRGSRGKGGLAALKAMMAAIGEQGRKAAIVADGSQGPALKAQAGVILLASKTGVPILPFAAAADRYWAFRSWDRTVLPKPFSRVALCFGQPFVVPPGVGSSELEAYRRDLEGRMLALYGEAWGRFAASGHEVGG